MDSCAWAALSVYNSSFWAKLFDGLESSCCVRQWLLYRLCIYTEFNWRETRLGLPSVEGLCPPFSMTDNPRRRLAAAEFSVVKLIKKAWAMQKLLKHGVFLPLFGSTGNFLSDHGCIISDAIFSNEQKRRECIVKAEANPWLWNIYALVRLKNSTGHSWAESSAGSTHALKSYPS